MGMTCHVINENTYQQEPFVLGCKWMKGSHDYLNIAEVMTYITDNYKIDLLKVTHTITDNASNFDPVERLFSGAIQVLTPRRNRLSDKTFEMLLCCKSNNNK